ncbi:MAG: glycosyltransferase [Gemmatimonadota bacterium]|nr:glycosyltransferase [Gemmatimonadota bacterium]
MNLSQVAALLLAFVLGTWMLLYGWVYYNTWLIWLGWRLRRATPVRPLLPGVLPRVTVQLPVYNEERVIERLLEAVGRLDWPAELLEIQLLDDSTDQTPAIAAAVIDRLRRRGLNVTHLRRVEREGYKAGALRDALATATGEFVLILDADFVPKPDLLRRLIPWFADSKVAMVQGRWGPLAHARSLIERSAGFWIDRHFVIEQLARSRSGQFFHFNGSGGIWRRHVIADAGGWSADTLAEDLDLSFRAWQRGWKFVFDFDTVIPAEVPSSVAALRIQQARWARGAFQMARKAIPRLAKETWRDRVTISLHLTGYSFPVLMLLLALTAGPAAWARQYHPRLGFLAADLPMVGFFVGMAAQALWQGLSSGWRRGWLEVEAAAIGIGMAPLVLKAGFSGLRAFGGEFKRTPKSTRAVGQTPTMVFVEAALGLAALASATLAVVTGSPWIALLPTLAGAGLITFAWRTVRP